MGWYPEAFESFFVAMANGPLINDEGEVDQKMAAYIVWLRVGTTIIPSTQLRLKASNLHSPVSPFPLL